ncbi:hypothetical protein MHYP_G00148300 [Metynnis hypsauchen]
MDQGPRSTPGFLGSVPRTVRFQWKDTEAGDAFPDRVPFIREVLFGALGLGTQDLICAQRNNAARFFDVSMSSEDVYRRVLERGVDVRDHPLGRRFELHPLGQNGRWMVTTFNPFMTAEVIRTFLRRYREVQPGENMVWDELGIWNGRRQFMVEFREDGKGGLTHPPAYFSLNGNKGYLFYRGQPAFCRGCLQHGHEVSGCRNLNCKNCLGQGHLARDCKNPRRCKSCGGEGHLAHSCPRQEVTYATVLAGAGGGPVAPRTVGEKGPTKDRAQESTDSGAPATATATSSPGVARGPGPGPHPLAGKEAAPISRPVKRARKRRRAQDEEMEKRQRAGSPGATPEGAPLSPPVPPKLEDTSVLVGDGTPPPPLIYGGREVPPNEAAYLDGTYHLTTNVRGLQKATKRTAVFRDLASTSASICCLQEVHLRDQRDEALFSQEWRRGKAYWSVGGVHSTGVGILFGDRSFEKKHAKKLCVESVEKWGTPTRSAPMAKGAIFVVNQTISTEIAQNHLPTNSRLLKWLPHHLAKTKKRRRAQRFWREIQTPSQPQGLARRQRVAERNWWRGVNKQMAAVTVKEKVKEVEGPEIRARNSDPQPTSMPGQEMVGQVNEQEVHDERGREVTPSHQESLDIQEGREDTPVSSLETVPDLAPPSSGSEDSDPFPNAQAGKRQAVSPLPLLAEKKQRARQDPGSSFAEDLDRRWPTGSPNEVSFLSIELKASTPKAPQKHGSVEPPAGETRFPPLPRRVKIKEEQISQEIT